MSLGRTTILEKGAPTRKTTNFWPRNIVMLSRKIKLSQELSTEYYCILPYYELLKIPYSLVKSRISPPWSRRTVFLKVNKYNTKLQIKPILQNSFCNADTKFRVVSLLRRPAGRISTVIDGVFSWGTLSLHQRDTKDKLSALQNTISNYSIISYWYSRYLKVMIKKWREKPHDSIELWNFVTRHPNNRSAYTLPSPLSASWRNLVKLVRWISNQWREVFVEENHCQPAMAVQVSDLFLERILFHYALTALVTRH